MPTLGGGGDHTELETRDSGIERAHPQKAEQSAVAGLSKIVVLIAEQSALNALSVSSIKHPANHTLANASSVLHNFETQRPLRKATYGTTGTVQLLTKRCESTGFACLLGLSHARRRWLCERCSSQSQGGPCGLRFNQQPFASAYRAG